MPEILTEWCFDDAPADPDVCVECGKPIGGRASQSALGGLRAHVECLDTVPLVEEE